MTIINGQPATRLQELRISLAWYHGYLACWWDRRRPKLSLQYWLGRWAGSRWGG
jgi:hypothetical protein